jgi:two-component system cell cycle sensor histidine kinase/response regulator CckA
MRSLSASPATPEAVSDRQRELWSWQRRAALGDLAAGIAHDFTNLLTAIRASCDLLKMELDPRDPRSEDVDAIARTSDQAAMLARQLMMLGRQRPPEIRILDLNALVAAFEPILLRLLTRNVQLVTTLGPAVGAVMGDAALIEHVLLTLAINARESMPRGGRLTITTTLRHLEEPLAHRHGVVPAGDYALLALRDEGDGMDDDALDRLFDPFSATQPLGPVAGLALASVYGIISHTQGVVVVTSRRGVGTEFGIYLRRPGG